jgi:hypothetical protein
MNRTKEDGVLMFMQYAAVAQHEMNYLAQNGQWQDAISEKRQMESCLVTAIERLCDWLAAPTRCSLSQAVCDRNADDCGACDRLERLGDLPEESTEGCPACAVLQVESCEDHGAFRFESSSEPPEESTCPRPTR